MDIKFAKIDKKDTLQKKLLSIIKDNDHFLKPQFIQVAIPVGNVGALMKFLILMMNAMNVRGPAKDNQWILCDSCESWYHRQCINLIDDDEWEALQCDNNKFKCHKH